ncbi:MAG: MBL fold metallo-hydrolase [Bdellovibrionales bacterium]
MLKPSDHFDGKLFFNPDGSSDKSLWDVYKWRRTSSPARWPLWVKNIATPDIATTVPPNTAVITFINHATVLVQLPGFNFLTDPVWSNRVSPFRWAGPQRIRAPGVDFDHLPPIHAVLVSHNHYDHLDIETLTRLESRFSPHFFVAWGDRDLLIKNGLKKVTQMDWWQQEQPIIGVHVTFVPARHWSARTFFDKRKSLWGGFVVRQNSRQFYYAGDSGYGPHFKQINARLGDLDLALLPIGAYEPRWFMRESHMNPQEAVQAHLDLQAKTSMAVHYGTFQLMDEGLETPVQELKKAMLEIALTESQFWVLNEGETRRLNLKE